MLHQATLLFLSISSIWWHALVPIFQCLPGDHPHPSLIPRCPLVTNTSFLSCFTPALAVLISFFAVFPVIWVEGFRFCFSWVLEHAHFYAGKKFLNALPLGYELSQAHFGSSLQEAHKFLCCSQPQLLIYDRLSSLSQDLCHRALLLQK